MEAVKVIVVFLAATDTPPRRRGWRTEDKGGMPHPARIPAELRSRNRNLEMNLLLCVDRSRRLSDGGWSETRMSLRRRNSRSLGHCRVDSFSPSTDTESDLLPIWRMKNFSNLSTDLGRAEIKVV